MAISQAKKLEIITKHGRKFTSKSAATPILEGVHYAADGSVVATDRHKLLRIKDAHAYTQPFTSHIVTGAPIDGNFPDTSKIIPTEFKAVITLISGYNRDDIKDATARVKLAVDVSKTAGDNSYTATLEIVEESLRIAVTGESNRISYVSYFGESDGRSVDPVGVNAEYLLASLNVFKDAGSARVRIGFTGTMSPILLTDEENGIDIIVLPYRRPPQ